MALTKAQAKAEIERLGGKLWEEHFAWHMRKAKKDDYVSIVKALRLIRQMNPEFQGLGTNFIDRLVRHGKN